MSTRYLSLVISTGRIVSLLIFLTVACPFSAHSMSCSLLFSSETYSKETYLKYFLNQKREPWHQPPPYDFTYIQKLVDKYHSSQKKTVPDLVKILAYLESYNYEVTVGRIVDGNPEKISGQLVDWERYESWIDGRWVLGKSAVFTKAGQVTVVNYADLDPAILEIRQTSIPHWVSEEPKLSKLATRLGIESLTHNVGYHAGTD